METKQNPTEENLKAKFQVENIVEISEVVPELSQEDNVQLIEQLKLEIEHLKARNGELELKNKELEGKCATINTSANDHTIHSTVLHTNKNWQREIIDTIPDLIWVKDTQGGFLDCNPMFEQLYGVKKADLIGKSDYDFVDKEHGDHFRKYDQLAITTGKLSINEEWVTFIEDGRKVYLETRKAPMHNNLGEIVGVLGIGRDITKRYQAEIELNLSENKFKVVFENSIIGKSITTLDGKLSINKSFANMLGYELDEFKFVLWKDITVPEDVEHNENLFEQIKSGKIDSARWEKRYIHKDGSIVWVDLCTTLQKSKDGVPLFFITEVVDITERKLMEEKLKASEKRLNALFSSMTEMVVMHELVFNEWNEPVDYRILDCNNAFASLVGLTKNEIIGRLGSDLYKSEVAPYLHEYIQVTITGKPHDFDTYYAPMDRHFLISVISYEKNKFTTIATDISNLQNIQKLLSDKNKELEDYLYIASHDLRSPLVNIQGFSQRLNKLTSSILRLLSENDSNENTKTEIEKIGLTDIPRTLEFIYSNVQKMEMLINGILQISRTGRVLMSVKKVDMNNLFKTIITALNFQLSDLNATVVLENITDCYGDENQLNQLFTNLISNCIKYHDSSRLLQIRISSKESYQKVIYSITDNGLGIAPKYLDKIWTVFYRVNPQGAVTGDGIGLNLVKRITEKHQGKVYVESEENVGSTFSVELLKYEF